MYDRILVPTAGSDAATAAVETAIQLATAFDSALHVVHVLELGELPPGIEDAGAGDLARRGREAVEAAGDHAREAGLDVTTAVVDEPEPIHQALLGYAGDNDVDCIVMGTHGRTGLDRVVLGSVTERTLRESPVPVVTVHEDTAFDGEIDSLLVPTDDSDCASDAVDHAIDLASETESVLHALHAVDVSALWGGIESGRVVDILEETGRQAVQRVADSADGRDLGAVETSVVTGVPHRVIAEYAADNDVDCIVMGTHGRTGLDRYLLGSVTERVIRQTNVPVVAINADTPE